MMQDIHSLMVADLANSGLEAIDIRSRVMDSTEAAACNLPRGAIGYVIPYYNFTGLPLPFYRIKLFNHETRYKQVRNTGNHVYFPPGFFKLLKGSKYVIITEGEKKAAAAVKLGFAACALGGVDSWRNRILLLPKDTEFAASSYNKGLIGAKLPTSDLSLEGVHLEPIAMGFPELAGYIRNNNLKVFIIFDTDQEAILTGLKPEVQRAAAELGFEFRRRGIPLQNIRQLILPFIEDTKKTGLDDFLMLLDNSKHELKLLLKENMKLRTCFPLHPEMHVALSKKLQNTKISRKDMQRVALWIITDLDSRGIRMHSKDEDQLYYFDNEKHKLTKVTLAQSNSDAPSKFATHLYKNYGISASGDQRLVKWLMTQYAGEAPLEDVRPYRIQVRPKDDDPDVLRYQLSDGLYVRITPDPDNPIEIVNNGDEGIMFESGQVQPIDPDELLKEFAKRQKEPLEMWWEDVLHEVRLKNHGLSATMLSLLYYISPWFYRWRGTQLPVELIIGEAGSGKSTLCELRLDILTGYPNLRNAPGDLKDWNATIANTGGLHVTDNVQLTDPLLRNRLSDEICRLVTEPDPHVEQRKYYTNADLIRFRVDSVFAFTSIFQPFTNQDILQRSFMVELDKLNQESSNDTGVQYNSTWKQQQLSRFGGRTAWLSHHLYVLHRLLHKFQDDWDLKYQARHRLINFEQLLMQTADLFGVEADWIPKHLSSQTSESTVRADWTLEGLKEFADYVRSLKGESAKKAFANTIGSQQSMALLDMYPASAIATWASQQDAHLECQMLINSRKLGKYFMSHKVGILHATGIQEGEMYSGKMHYKINPPS